MKFTSKDRIGDIVADNYKTATVFKDFNIDFCCNGGRTIDEACSQKNISAEKLLTQLNKIIAVKNYSTIDFKNWPMDLIVDYIEKTHHRYVEQKIEEIMPYLNKLVIVHGANHPELKSIQEEFVNSANELLQHMKKEENILFPYIRQLSSNVSGKSDYKNPGFGTVENPINMMKHEHNIEGERFRKISSLSQNYSPPSDACNTYRVTYSLLQEFEDDLHKHIHLENNILFPMALEAETELN